MQSELCHLGQLVASVRDILDERVVDIHPPAWAVRRGWADFLVNLSEAELFECETRGLAAMVERLSMPASLQQLCVEVSDATAAFAGAPPRCRPVATRGVPERKRSQVAALIAATDRLSRPVSRVVDFGAGHGHLTRALASHLEVPAVGLDRDVARVEKADSLSDANHLSFVVVDGGIGLGPLDLAVGLHACGELGDTLIESAAGARAQVMLVSCCLQKISGARRPPRSRHGDSFAKEMLGVTNLSYGEGPIHQAMHGRAMRHALRLLLKQRGVVEPVGTEARGINRKRFRKGLRDVALQACQLRGLDPPTDAEISDCERRGLDEFQQIRRLSLPRGMLGRVVECCVVLDRAAFLQEAGLDVEVFVLFDTATSPRNLAIIAS